MADKLKESRIHSIIKSLSPKHRVHSPKLGSREIPRSITKEGLELTTKFFNDLLEEFVQCCEVALRQLNENPNAFYSQHRYDDRVIRLAIEKLKGESA